MRSKPPHGRDRQDRRSSGGHQGGKTPNRAQGQRDRGGKGRQDWGGQDRGAQDHGGQDRAGKSQPGKFRGGKFQGGKFKSGKFRDRNEQGGKDFSHAEAPRKASGPKDFKHTSVRPHSEPTPAGGEHGGFKKDHPKKSFEPRPRADHADAAPKPQGRVDHGGGAVDVWLFGHHAVTAALANQERRILRLLVTTEALERLRSEESVPKDALNRARTVSRREIDNTVGENAVHQGVAMLTRTIEHHLEDVLEIAKENETCCVVLLDQVSDPHNVGAILRSAAAFNAAAVITLDRRAAAETGTMAKSASGALDRIPFVQTTNLARAIEVLKQNQFWVLGLEADGEKKIAEVDLKGRIAFVMGTEGEGLRRLVRESCDQIVRLPINATSESLNVSNAAAIALYERSRQIG